MLRSVADSSEEGSIKTRPVKRHIFSSATHEVSTRESRSEEHTSELQSQSNIVCRLLLEKKKKHVRCADLRPADTTLLVDGQYVALWVAARRRMLLRVRQRQSRHDRARSRATVIWH